jgi:hypothetical protein
MGFKGEEGAYPFTSKPQTMLTTYYLVLTTYLLTYYLLNLLTGLHVLAHSLQYRLWLASYRLEGEVRGFVDMPPCPLELGLLRLGRLPEACSKVRITGRSTTFTPLTSHVFQYFYVWRWKVWVGPTTYMYPWSIRTIVCILHIVRWRLVQQVHENAANMNKAHVVIFQTKKNLVQCKCSDLGKMF